MVEARDSAADTEQRSALVHREIFQLIALMALAIAAFLLTRAIASSNREMTVRDAAEWFRRGQQAMETGHLDQAIDSLRRATVRNRGDKRYVLTLAEALALKRDQEGAREMSEPIVPPAQQRRLRENRVSLILTIVIGVVCGLAAVLCTVAIEQTSHLLFVLLSRSLVALIHADRGFDPANTLTARLDLPRQYAAADRVAFADIRHALLEELRGDCAVGEIDRLSNGAIAGDQFDVPVRALAVLDLSGRLFSPYGPYRHNRD